MGRLARRLDLFMDWAYVAGVLAAISLMVAAFIATAWDMASLCSA